MFFKNKKDLNKHLEEGGLIEDENIVDAFLKIDRADFVLEEFKKDAYNDTPLSISYMQTISQPKVVAFMLSLLSPKKGDNILDIGFGSGWTTALLAQIVGGNGSVCGIERVPEIYEFGKNNISKYSFIEKEIVKVFLDDGRKGKEEFAPYDGILISASDKDASLALNFRKNLKPGGRIVMPIRDSVYLFINKEKDFEMKEYYGFSFVPLV